MSNSSEENLDGTTIIEAKYARRIDRGMALSLFDFPDTQTAGDGHSKKGYSAQRAQSGKNTPAKDNEGRLRQEDSSEIQATETRSLLTLPPETRDRIWRFVLGNLDNAPETVQCRHCYPRSRHDLLARPSRNPRLCFGLQSSVKAGKFPSVLVVNNQVYGEAAKLLYAGRSFTFCTWGCYSGWAERLLGRDKKGGEEMLSMLHGVTVHLDMQNGYRRGDAAKEWAKAVQDSVKQTCSMQMITEVEMVEPTFENQLLVTEARLKFRLQDT